MPDRTTTTRYVIRYTDFGQYTELNVPQKYSDVERRQLALWLGGTLHRITITDEPVHIGTTDAG